MRYMTGGYSSAYKPSTRDLQPAPHRCGHCVTPWGVSTIACPNNTAVVSHD